MSIDYDNVVLNLPFKPEYVSVARLTVSGIASRIGFDMETMEDIKVAVSEVCNKLVATESCAESYNIRFEIYQKKLRIVFECSDSTLKCIFGEVDQELGLALISALMDETELCTSSDYILAMTKAV